MFPQSGPDNPFPQPVMGNLEIFSPMTDALSQPARRDPAGGAGSTNRCYFAGVLGEQRLAGLWLSYYLLALAPVWLFFLHMFAFRIRLLRIGKA